MLACWPTPVASHLPTQPLIHPSPHTLEYTNPIPAFLSPQDVPKQLARLCRGGPPKAAKRAPYALAALAEPDAAREQLAALGAQLAASGLTERSVAAGKAGNAIQVRRRCVLGLVAVEYKSVPSGPSAVQHFETVADDAMHSVVPVLAHSLAVSCQGPGRSPSCTVMRSCMW